MPRHFTTIPPQHGVPVENQLPSGTIEEPSPFTAAKIVCDAVRDEHGRKGVGLFLAAAAPFLPGELITEAARHFHVELPPEAGGVPEKLPQKEAPPIPPELLLSLLQGGGGGGLDPMMLLKMMQKG